MGKNTQRNYSYYDQGWREAVKLMEYLKKRHIPLWAWVSNFRTLRARKNAVPKPFQHYYRMGVRNARRAYGVPHV